MPGSVGRTNAAAAPQFSAPVKAAVASVAKKVDERIQSLDTNRNGKITEAEFAPFMEAFEKANQRMERNSNAWSPTPAAPPNLRQDLEASRAAMTDAERLDMVIAQALQKLPEGTSTVAVKDLKKLSRQALNELTAQATKRPSGGLVEGLGFLIAASILPDAIYNVAMQR